MIYLLFAATYICIAALFITKLEDWEDRVWHAVTHGVLAMLYIYIALALHTGAG